MTAPKIYDCEQGSLEWFQLRMGLPTASEFATIMAKGRGGAESKQRLTYMRKLAGEIISGSPMESYTNGHMERGRVMEAEARDAYALIRDVDVREVGFIRGEDAGCSPDGLIGDDGMVEIKTAQPHILIEAILADKFPPAHKAQCQGQLWIAEREWLDLVIYWPGMPLFIKRATRDEGYIVKLIEAVDLFNMDLSTLVDQVMEKAA